MLSVWLFGDYKLWSLQFTQNPFDALWLPSMVKLQIFFILEFVKISFAINRAPGTLLAEKMVINHNGNRPTVWETNKTNKEEENKGKDKDAVALKRKLVRIYLIAQYFRLVKSFAIESLVE